MMKPGFPKKPGSATMDAPDASEMPPKPPMGKAQKSKKGSAHPNFDKYLKQKGAQADE